MVCVSLSNTIIYYKESSFLRGVYESMEQDTHKISLKHLVATKVRRCSEKIRSDLCYGPSVCAPQVHMLKYSQYNSVRRGGWGSNEVMTVDPS